MVHYPILQVQFMITLINVSDRDGYVEVARLHGLHTQFFLWGHMKSLVYQTLVEEIYLHKFWALHKRFNRHQV